jgi:hypothetical protein
VDPLGLAPKAGDCPSIPNFHVGTDGPANTLPSTGYHYLNSSYAERTKESMEAPLSYFGLKKYQGVSRYAAPIYRLRYLNSH